MITPNGRGVIAGGEEAQKQKKDMPLIHIKFLALCAYSAMKSAGYAHIDPENEFVEGFLIGFSNARYFTVHVAN